MKRIIIAALVTLCSLAGFTLDQGSCKDSRDGKVYATVKIGSQTWMAQNLEYRTKTGTRAWGDDMGNVKKYGYLYDWAAAREACPKGWRLPSDADWKMLELHLGMAPDEFEKNRKRAEGLGLKLKSATGWYENGNGNNGSGFNALPGGACLFYDNSYHFLGELAYFWTSTAEGNQDAYARVFRYDETYAERSLFAKSNSLSVRCVKD